ncbi:MAG: hypothetical protein IKY00_06325 [Clostridia bacterium]|nr:hypothetical protein [Clostridia bacterium]
MNYCPPYFEKHSDDDYRAIFVKIINSAKGWFPATATGILPDITAEAFEKYGIKEFADWESATLDNEAWFDIICETYLSARRRYNSDRIAEEDYLTGNVPNLISGKVLSDIEETLVSTDKGLATILLNRSN